MTEEEKKIAEEYFKATYPVYIGCDKFTEDIKDAVIYGLKAGRPKWHKVADGDLPNENVKLILVRDRWKNHFLNYHLIQNKMIVEMIDQFDEWVELPIEE